MARPAAPPSCDVLPPAVLNKSSTHSGFSELETTVKSGSSHILPFTVSFMHLETHTVSEATSVKDCL